MTISQAKVALITGAARGIGLATSKKFLDAGWNVAMLDIQAEMLTAAIAEIDLPDRCFNLACDVSDADQVAQAMTKLIAHFGRLDAVVNNAGTATFKPIRNTTFEEWSHVLDVNLSGPFIVTQAATDHLIQSCEKHNRQSAVVNITSISGLRASTLRVAYGVSKAGLAQLTKQQAVELGEFGIRVNAVAPGPVDTAMALKVHTPDIRAAYHDAMPLNRYGTENEIANMILFLCSDEASFVTGQVIAVDGGFDSTGIGLPSLR